MSRSAAAPGAPRRLGIRVVAALVAVALGLLGATLAVSPAYANGDLKGTLVDQLGQPVLGLAFDVWSTTGTQVATVTSDGTTGGFDLNLPDGGYYYWVHEGAADAGGDTYALRSENFFISGGDADLGNLVIKKHVAVSGTIANWTAAMGNLHVQVKTDLGGGNWQTVSSGDSSGASFSIPTAVVDGDYTLYFQLPSTSTAPFLDAFLGGEFFDPAAASTVPGIAGTPITGISMTMPDAAFITGTVTDATTGLGISGIDVTTEDRPDELFFAEDFTDADGAYTLRVVPGLTYAVYADDPSSAYASLTYQNLDPCGCTFTPVQSTYAVPATGIDFQLVPDASAVFIEGVVFDDSVLSPTPPTPFENVQIHLYKPVSGGWTQVDVTQSDSTGQFELALPAFGSYRVRFEYGGTWLPLIDGLAAEGSASGPDPISGCFVDTETLDASSVDTHVAYFIIAGLNQAGGCGPEPAIPGSSGGTSSAGHGRSHPASVASVPIVATPTPTPTATPTPTPTPSASSPGDSVSTPKPISPAPAVFDLTWLWIVLAIIAALIIAFVVIRVIRRP